MTDIEAIDKTKTIEGLKELEKFLFSEYERVSAEEANVWYDRFLAVDNALELLKEQEGVVPYIDIDEAKCPVCKVKLTRQELIGNDALFEDFFDYCPHCGKPVLWKGGEVG